MLSVFPELFNYSHLAPFLLRLVLAVVLLRIGYWGVKKEIKYEKIIGITRLIGGIFLLVGLLTQAAALLIIITILAEAIGAKIKKIALNQKLLKFTVLGISFSLMLLGPGALAIDLPL